MSELSAGGVDWERQTAVSSLVYPGTASPETYGGEWLQDAYTNGSNGGGESMATPTVLPRQKMGTTTMGRSLGRTTHPRSLRKKRRLRAVLVIALGTGAIALLTVQTYRWLTGLFWSTPSLELVGEQLSITLDQPPIPIPEPKAALLPLPPTHAEATLTQTVAEKTIQTWLATKAIALGPDHKIDQLPQILAEPALSAWQQRATEAQQQGWYWKYQHKLEPTSLKLLEVSPNQAQVQVQVGEAAELYEGGQLNSNASYDAQLLVRYQLVRNGTQWRIQDMAVQ
ncbi:ARC6/PARC6 family protein [Neosynechococcus sphagnicola]|uniref:ARC6/PARC6 family protein n=1 Tax=Neosynechococcus sphagnicola TaxID=1501145 RepID=UPI00195543BB|nr:ARC6/PARC6 family protein [Neosynechococcus sphagnicola]